MTTEDFTNLLSLDHRHTIKGVADVGCSDPCRTHSISPRFIQTVLIEKGRNIDSRNHLVQGP